MEIGIDSFADKREGTNSVQAINNVIERIVFADKVGLNTFGIGEHHRKEFLDSAPFMILSAAAARTKNINARFNIRWKGRDGCRKRFVFGGVSFIWIRF